MAEAKQITSGLLAELVKERVGAEKVYALDTSGGCGAMFQLFISSRAFEGLALLKRHRLVNDALKEEMRDIHALQLKTWTPEEWERKKGTLPEELRE